MKCANQVLDAAEIDARLASDARVDLCEQRRWHLYHSDSTHVHRSGKSRNVADDSTPDSDYGRLPSHLEIRKSLKETRDRPQRFGALAFRDQFDWKPFVQTVPEGFVNSGLRYNKKRAAQAGPLKMYFKMIELSAPHDDVVSRLRQSDRNRL